jgi:hypothetical protein
MQRFRNAAYCYIKYQARWIQGGGGGDIRTFRCRIYDFPHRLQSTTTAIQPPPPSVEQQQNSLVLFPHDIQDTIVKMQAQFDVCCSSYNDGLLELYDQHTTEQMWRATILRNSKNEISEAATTAHVGNDTSVVTTSATSKEKKAAVLILLVYYKDEISIVFTRRSKQLSSHASQISFPGGHYENNVDATLVDTATREAVEELYDTNNDDNKMHPQQQQHFRQNLYIFGSTTAVPSLRGIPVTSVLSFYNLNSSFMDDRGPITQLWPGNQSEVELVFTVPLATLIRQLQQQQPMLHNTNTIVERSNIRTKSSSPQFPTPHGTIWGLTAYILQPILQKLIIPVFDKKAER